MKKHSFLSVFKIIAICLITTLYLQGQSCGTEVTQRNIDYINNVRPQTRSMFRDMGVGAMGIIDIPIKFHVICNDNGSGCYPIDLLEKKLSDLNKAYRGANLRFVSYGEPSIIYNSELNDFDKNQEEAQLYVHTNPNILDIFCVNPKSYGLFGYTYLPGENPHNFLVITRDGLNNASTLAHELGHFFGLYHTHGKTNTGITDEYVSRASDHNKNNIWDCEEMGDDLCDTDADYNLGALASDCDIENCSYTGYKQDLFGEIYRPDPENVMSYFPNRDCRRTFTPGQLARISAVARQEHENLRLPPDYHQTEGKIVAGDIKFSLRNGQAMPVSKDFNLFRFTQPYYEGQQFYFNLRSQSAQPLYVYIVNMDARKSVVTVYPDLSKGELPYVPPYSSLDIFKGGAIKLDSNAGREYACFLISLEPLNPSAITSALQNSTELTFTQRLYDVLGDQLLLLDAINYGVGDAVHFSAPLKTGQILPVIFEMDHR